MLITREEAEKLNVPGWDVFQKTHLMYMDGINRQAGVAELNYEAFKAFSDTILFAKSDEIIKESQQHDEFIILGKKFGIDDYPLPIAQVNFGRFRNYEYLKIGCGFELSLKALLLKHGFVIHEIDRNDARYAKLAKDQENRPVMIEELFRVSAYMHNGSINILPGITKNGLKFSIMLNKEGYKNSFGLDAVSLELINEYRKLRNMIHLPGDPIDTLRLSCMSWQDKIEFIHSYIDKYIVSTNRKIVAEWGLHKTLGIEKW